MFKGTIKGNSRKILLSLLKERNYKNYAIGCCGAFTIENLILLNLKAKNILSSDVSEYTTALGYFLSDKDFCVHIKDPTFKFLDKYIEGDLIDKVAAILYLQDISEYCKKSNLYYSRMWDNYLIGYEDVIEVKKQRLKEYKERFRDGVENFSYIPRDVTRFIDDIPDSSYLFVSFPPFYVGGYEKLYSFINDVLETSQLTVEYNEFNDDSLIIVVDRLLERNIDFIIGTNRVELFEDKDGVKIVAHDYFSKGELVHFITNHNYDRNFAKISTPKYPMFLGLEVATADDIRAMNEKTKIEIKEISLPLFDSIRMSVIAKNIKPVSPTLKFGCFADNKLFGIFGIDFMRIDRVTDCFYLLADMPVTNEGKIAKLVVGLATTKEVRKFIKYKYLFDYDLIRTTAFTNNPVSMKYRNFFKVEKRGEKEGRKFINYIAPMGSMNIHDVYHKWLSLRGEKDEV